MYAFHGEHPDAVHTDDVIHSPKVPVFRTDGGELLDEPWPLSIVTSPAANATALTSYAPERLPNVPPVMKQRAHKVLNIAPYFGHRRLILGAWGCGAFGIETVMANVFDDLLSTTFAEAFELVMFAITDWSDDERFMGPFRAKFGSRQH